MMSSLYEAKQFAHDWVDQNSQRLSDFDLEIWRYAEPAWREYRSARPTLTCCDRRGSTSRRVAVICRRPSWRPGGPVVQ